MRAVFASAVVTALSVCAPAFATPTLQFDVNSIGIQATNSGGTNTPFGGLTHTGAVVFSLKPSTRLEGVSVESVPSGPWIDQGFSGSISNFTGSVLLNNGIVTGGSITLAVNGGTDSYSASIVPNAGHVKTYVGGGFIVQGLTFQGAFSDNQFGNVNVAQWFAHNGALLGSFLQFNFNPDATGAGFSDMDIFVDSVVPLPPAAWAGIGMLASIATVQWVRRRK
jgi:hypothetical protein